MERFIKNTHPLKEEDDELHLSREIAPTFVNGGTIFDRKLTFEIPNDLNGLTRLSLRATYTNGGGAAVAIREQHLGAHAIEYVELRGQRSKTVVARWTSQTLIEYLHRFDGTYLNGHITNSMRLEGALTAGQSGTFFTPLLGFYNRDKLPTRYIEKLELFVQTARNSSQAGLGGNLTATEWSLVCHYEESQEDGYEEDTIEVPDQFQELDVQLPTGSTSYKQPLRCPHPSEEVCIFIQNANKGQHDIHKMQIDSGESPWLTVYGRDNYDVYSNWGHHGFSVNTPMIYKFRSLINFNDKFKQSYMTLSFGAIPGGVSSRMYILFHHKKLLHFGKDGMLSEEPLGYLAPNKN